MVETTQSTDFLRSLRESYDSKAKVEVNTSLSEVRFEGARPTHLRLLIRLFLGCPVRIAEQLVYPVEMPAVATFDAGRDGETGWGEICQFVLQRALEMAHPGASSLLDTNSDAADRMRLLLTGACEGPLLFEVEIPKNRS
jgi:hypothetical protein